MNFRKIFFSLYLRTKISPQIFDRKKRKFLADQPPGKKFSWLPPWPHKNKKYQTLLLMKFPTSQSKFEQNRTTDTKDIPNQRCAREGCALGGSHPYDFLLTTMRSTIPKHLDSSTMTKIQKNADYGKGAHAHPCAPLPKCLKIDPPQYYFSPSTSSEAAPQSYSTLKNCPFLNPHNFSPRGKIAKQKKF